MQNKTPILWFTGLSGSGKSTLANKLAEVLSKRGLSTSRLDGDTLRSKTTVPIGFTKADRDKNIQKAINLAKQERLNGNLVLASFITPYEDQRSTAKRELPEMLEIFVNAPLEVCEERDVKGLYKKARAGEIQSFTGISDPYEAPKNPDLEVRTDQLNLDESVAKIISFLEGRDLIQSK